MSLYNINNPSRTKSTKILAIGSYSILVVDIIQGLALVPLYISFLGERLYGFWLASGGIIAILGFLDLGISNISCAAEFQENMVKKNLRRCW